MTGNFDTSIRIQNLIQMLLHMTGKEVKKLECVGHRQYLQKRLGARLRKLKTTNKSVLSDGKPIGGKGRLTDNMINKLQNYY